VQEVNNFKKSVWRRGLFGLREVTALVVDNFTTELGLIQLDDFS